MIDFSKVKDIVIPEGKVKSVTVGGITIWKKSRLPLEYQEVEYIESTGTQWIDTGIIPNTETALELLASGISANSFSTSTGTWFFGARTGYLNNAFGSYYNPTEKRFYYAFGNVMPNYSYTSLYEGIKKIYANKSGLYVDDTKIVSVSSQNFTAPVSLSLFGLNNNGSIISRTSYKVHQCKIWNNSTLVRDFIPCYRKSDGKTGMYDLVTKEFFINEGTSEFIAGPMVN